jgi:uncharacterized protein YbaP (TraB family)
MNSRWKIFCFPLLLTLLLLCSSCKTVSPSPNASAPAVSSAQQEPVSPSPALSPSSPLLWKAEDPNTGGTLYLFGSIHVGQEDLYPLPEAVMNAYQTSDALAVECDIVTMQKDLGTLTQYTQAFLYEGNDNITNHLSPETYQKMTDFLAQYSPYGTSLALFQSYCPAFWSSLIDECILDLAGLQSNLGLDHFFLTLALEEEKEVLEIESPAFQFQLLASVPDALQDYLIRSTINAPEQEADSLVELYEAVKTGNETALNALLFEDTDLSQEETLTEEERQTLQPLMEDYTKSIYTTRNAHMTKTAKTYLEEGRQVFFVVGMAHMLGKDGIVAQLSAAGYKVAPVPTGPQASETP